MSLGRIYDYLIVEVADPLTRGWPLIDSPFPIMIITTAYIYFVMYAGPRYMKNRPSFNLKTFILVYNLFQILANAWIVKEHVSAGWLTEYSLFARCNASISDSNGFKLITTMWWTLIIRLMDYIETCIFVLRKKQNQVSFLHVYHHVYVVFFVWYFLKYVPEPEETIISLINCSVHVLMYTYYFAAAWSTEFQQVVSPIKPYITKIQLTQFAWFLILAFEEFVNPKCTLLLQRKAKIIEIYIGLFNIFLFIYLFYDFYKNTYGKVRKQKNAKQKE